MVVKDHVYYPRQNGNRIRYLLLACHLFLFLAQLQFFAEDNAPLSDIQEPKGSKVVVEPPVKNEQRAIVSMLQNSRYVGNALVLGHTLRKHNPTLKTDGIDQILIIPFNHDISVANMTRLQQVGWTIRYEEDIKLQGLENLQSHYRRNFMKLRLWRWTEYAKVGYIDADCMIRGDIRLLVSNAFEFGAVQDTWEWVMPADNFNAGVLSITPSAEKFAFLMNTAALTPLQYSAEQGLLNIVFLRPPEIFQSKATVFLRTELPMAFNLNICAYFRHRVKWDALWPDARIVHFTMVKPNAAEYRFNFPDYEQPVKAWWDEWDEMTRKFNWVD